MSAQLGACTIPVDTSARSETATTRVVVVTSQATPVQVQQPVASPAPASVPASTTEQSTSLSVESVTSAYGGSAGIAIIDANGPHTAGSLQSDVAWSTIKVPIALAAARAGKALPQLVSSALQNSDNAAAQSLWDSLGSPVAAAQLVQTEISAIAPAPRVNAQVTRPDFTAFGQTQWTLQDQATFGQKLTCHPYANTVTGPMANVVAGQRYGLGTLSGAHFKGGWGPDPSGGYLARQFGYIQTPSGVYGIAIAAKPADGSYETAQAMLTKLASISAGVNPIGSNPCT